MHTHLGICFHSSTLKTASKLTFKASQIMNSLRKPNNNDRHCFLPCAPEPVTDLPSPQPVVRFFSELLGKRFDRRLLVSLTELLGLRNGLWQKDTLCFGCFLNSGLSQPIWSLSFIRSSHINSSVFALVPCVLYCLKR